jgi:hypothetical protein
MHPRTARRRAAVLLAAIVVGATLATALAPAAGAPPGPLAG